VETESDGLNGGSFNPAVIFLVRPLFFAVMAAGDPFVEGSGAGVIDEKPLICAEFPTGVYPDADYPLISHAFLPVACVAVACCGDSVVCRADGGD
jgi:hypothetical protein